MSQIQRSASGVALKVGGVAVTFPFNLQAGALSSDPIPVGPYTELALDVRGSDVASTGGASPASSVTVYRCDSQGNQLEQLGTFAISNGSGGSLDIGAGLSSAKSLGMYVKVVVAQASGAPTTFTLAAITITVK